MGSGLFSGFEWASWGDGGYVDPVTNGLEFEVSFSGARITYEVGIPMFIWYGGRSGEDTVDAELTAGSELGLDIVVDTLFDSVTYGDGWGMLSENSLTGKYRDAGQFRVWTLVSGSLPPIQCGNWDYFDGDIDRNCDVNLADFAQMSRSVALLQRSAGRRLFSELVS